MAFKQAQITAALNEASTTTSQQEAYDPHKDELISDYARRLRLDSGNFLSIYPSVAFTNRQDFVLGLLQEMLKVRTSSSISRNIKMAGFPDFKTLQAFDPSNIELPPVIKWEELCSCNFVNNHENIVMLGNAGTGKTHLATALGIQACQQGHKVLFYRTSTFMETLNQANDNHTLKTLYKRLSRCDLLILDEMGYTKVNINGTRLFFDVLSELFYEKRSLIVTTNLSLSQWNQIFEDEHLAQATLDRLIHHCYLIKHEGESYRLTHSIMAKANNSTKPQPTKDKIRRL